MPIDLYTWSTPNGRKVSVMLEECGLPYTVHKIDISKGDQFTPEFVAINPNSKIPAIVDPEGPKGKLVLFESGAILIYLAEKTGKFLTKDPVGRHTVLQWLMFQMGGVGPMFGQAHHFMRAAKEQIPYGIERYGNEAKRLYGVMNKRLGEAKFLAGDDYSIADIATYPWVARHEWHRVALEDFPKVKRWYDTIGARPAVARGMAVPG
jgi:GSH-dependent disulfide-bond oxidoreductase